MTAFCRYVDATGVRAGFYRSVGGGSEGLVCPLASVIGEPAERSLATTAGWMATDWAADLDPPPEHSASWQPAPATFLPPVADPSRIICIGLNYRDHAAETGAAIPSEPVVFGKFAATLAGHGHPIRLPAISQKVDYEAELVAVIGRPARDVDADEALRHVFGYTAGHDVSARDWQKGRPGGQWLLGKTFDTFAPVGPAIVTADEFGDPDDAAVRMVIGGETMQAGNTADMIFSVAEVIAFLSRFFTLQPGDLVFTGTPAGVGAARTPPRYLADGDECRVEIDGLPALVNPVVGMP